MSELLKAIPGDPIRITTNPWTEPFWLAAKEGRLIAQRCDACGEFRMPPSPFCAHCQSWSATWETLSGRVELFSYTVCYKSPYPGKVPDFAYAPAVVEVPEASRIRLIGNLVGLRQEDIRIGMPLDVTWMPTGDDWAVPNFRPAPAA